MRRVKLLGVALMAIFAFGVVVAASASAEEKAPAGILYLPGQSGAVTISGEGGEVRILSIGLLKHEIKCTNVKFTSTVGGGAGEETHATLSRIIEIPQM